MLQTGESLDHLRPDHPLREFSRVFKDLSLATFPTGILIIVKNIQILIPKIDRARILKLLHRFHFSLPAMINRSKVCLYWPSLNNDLKNIWDNCMICQVIRRSHNPPLPLAEEVSVHNIMDSMAADWCSYGSQYYLIICERASSYIWCKEYEAQSTANSIAFFEEIFHSFGKCKEVTTDGGPAFRVAFSNWCGGLFIDHRTTQAYQPRTNGRVERQIGLMKDLLRKNSIIIGGGLPALVAGLNNRISSIPNALSAATRFHGRELSLDLPHLSPEISPEQREAMLEAMRRNRQRYNKSLASQGTICYEIGQDVLVYNPKTKSFSDRGVISGWNPDDDELGPRNYQVEMTSGATRQVNTSWLSVLPREEN